MGELARDGAGARRDFRSHVSGGGYGRVSVPPSVKIETPMCETPWTKERDTGAAAQTTPIEASIFTSRKTGAHYVLGEIPAAFLRAGGLKRFGYPVTDEVPTPDDFGLMTRFERGTIYWYRGHTAEIGEPRLPPRRE